MKPGRSRGRIEINIIIIIEPMATQKPEKDFTHDVISECCYHRNYYSLLFLAIHSCSFDGDSEESLITPTDNSSGDISELPSPNSSIGQPPVKKRKKENLKVDEVDEALLKGLYQMEESRAQRKKDDEEEFFGKHVAAVLRRLPNRERAMARLRIQQVLMDVEFPEPDVAQPLPNYSTYGYQN